MLNYYVNTNAQPNGDHEVHRQGCSKMPLPQNLIHLGSFVNCHGAVQKAKGIYLNADGCAICSYECHTS